MQQIIQKYFYSSLVILSLLCGIIWRAELEFHGWEGLIWLSYFHYAIPIGLLLFLIWANFFINLSGLRKFALNVVLVLYCITFYYLLYQSLIYTYAAGPLGLLLYTPEWEFYLYHFSIFLIIPLIPIGAYFILRIFNHKPSWKYLALSFLGILSSVAFTPYMLELIHHQGSHDNIHTLKSGILIPFWVFSLGLLFINLNVASKNPNQL